jgi:hypothetical protein
LTGRERILAALRGDEPDFVPFAPNIRQWFYYHQTHHSLPPELSGVRHPFDAIRRLGGEIMARWDTQHSGRTVYAAGEFTSTQAKVTGTSPW